MVFLFSNLGNEIFFVIVIFKMFYNNNIVIKFIGGRMFNIDSIMNLAVNAVLIIIFLVKQSCNVDMVKNQLQEFKTDIQEKLKENKKYTDNLFKNFKDDLQEKLNENRKHTDEHIKRLEEKQDKHNELMQRMYVAENKIDDLEEQISTRTTAKKRKTSK